LPEPITIVAIGCGLLSLSGHLARRYFELAKEIFDLVLGSVAMLATLPLWFACAAIIKLSDGGPVFFCQTRVGKDGRLFRMFKFRTMRPDAESPGQAVWARKDDPRVLPACRWMRTSHVDELPQLVNVLLGDMSLVGPRPERPEILRELEKHYPEVRRRLAVRPGITGLAQVSAGYDTTIEKFRHKLHADLKYISQNSWRQELRILAATLTKLRDKQAN